MKAQISTPLLASILIAMIMLLLVSTYAVSQRLIISAEPSPVPITMKHIKSDLDRDFSTLFCDAGLCISSNHPSESATLIFSLDYHSGLFGNVSNFTSSYVSFFNSTRAEFQTTGLSSQLSSNYLLLRDNATDSNYSLLINGNASLNFNSSIVDAYGLYYNCTNTTNIIWNQDIGDNRDIDLNFSLPGYVQDPINNTEINSKAAADGGVSYNGARYFVNVLGQTSSLGFDNTGPADLEHRTYLSFNTDYLPDDAIILSAEVLSYVETIVVSHGLDPEWRVDYLMGPDVIGPALTSGVWGNKGFVSVGSLDFKGSAGWRNFSIPSEYLDDISVDGQMDFELLPRWGDGVGPSEQAYMTIRQTEHILNAYHPYLMVRYSFSGQCSLNRSKNYSTNFTTACGPVNASFIQGNLYTNFSYMNFSLNTTSPTNQSTGLFPLMNLTSATLPNSDFSDICASGREPTYPAEITEQKYGSFSLGGSTVNIIAANRSNEYNTAYFDADGDCNFTEFNDEYFVVKGDWVNLGGKIAKLSDISQDGSSAQLEFTSAGVNSTLLNFRLVQPIYLNR